MGWFPSGACFHHYIGPSPVVLIETLEIKNEHDLN